MANPHFEIKITKRSKRQSAVAGAAYQSGENLFSEYDQKHKDYRKKEGVVYTEIMLPSHAPPEYADREQLWNAVEAVENQWNSQLARRFVLALPREVPEELYPQMVQDYCNQFFVSKGMIVDFAIHDPKPPGHNPHCHVMLTMRAMDGHGKWLPKARKVYDLDENGERIRLPSGNWKSHKEDTVDWNEQYHGQEWRTGWETVQNRYLEMVNSPVRVDLRSYEKQGLDIIPTVHMGAAVTQMERRGIQTNIGNLNRDIKAANRMMSVIRSTIQNLRDWISDILEARKELLAEKKPETASPDLINLLRDYLNLRKAERRDWSRYGQQKGATKDLQSFVNATNYLKVLLCKQAAKNFHTICKKETALKRVLSNLLSAVSLLRFKAVFSCGFRVPPGSGLYQSCAAGSVCIPAGQKYCSPRPRKSCPADRKTLGLPSRCIGHRW